MIAAQADKRQRQFDKTIEEWREKCEGLESDVEKAQVAARCLSEFSDSFRPLTTLCST